MNCGSYPGTSVVRSVRGGGDECSPPRGRTIMRSAFDKLISWTGVLLVAVLLVAGGLTAWAHSYIGDQVTEQLTMQNITMPEGDALAGLPKADADALKPYAGSPMDTGPEATAYANH